jgi:hypothetical protein
MHVRRVRLTWGLGLAGALLLATGCGGARSTGSYVPSDTTGRNSLTAALEAWKAGKPLGRIDSVSPPVETLDWQWKSGKKLREFEILGEVAGDGPKQYRVKITVEGAQPKEVIYVIVGRDPVWVFREEDYKRTAGM